MIGIDAAQVLDSSRKERVEHRVFEVPEEYNLEVEEELDLVDVKYLGQYVNARTSFQAPGSGSILIQIIFSRKANRSRNGLSSTN